LRTWALTGLGLIASAVLMALVSLVIK